MNIWTTTTIAGVLVAAVMALYFMWSHSGWLADRRHSLSKLDALVVGLDNFGKRFPHLSAELCVNDLHEVWPQQRAQVEEKCSFVAWIKAGRPRETSVDPDSSALFQFARSQAGPLVWSMDQVEGEPDTDLVNRIRAVISRDTSELRFSPSKAPRLATATPPG